MKDVVLVSYTKEELIEFFKEAVKQLGVVSGSNKTEESESVHYMNVSEASQYLNLSPQTVYTLTSKRLIPFIKKRKKLMFDRVELEKWIKEGRKKTIKEIQDEC